MNVWHNNIIIIIIIISLQLSSLSGKFILQQLFSVHVLLANKVLLQRSDAQNNWVQPGERRHEGAEKIYLRKK